MGDGEDKKALNRHKFITDWRLHFCTKTLPWGFTVLPVNDLETFRRELQRVTFKRRQQPCRNRSCPATGGSGGPHFEISTTRLDLGGKDPLTEYWMSCDLKADLPDVASNCDIFNLYIRLNNQFTETGRSLAW